MIADYEFKREKTIKDAECFMKYEISFIEQCFDQDMNALQDEYEVKKGAMNIMCVCVCFVN